MEEDLNSILDTMPEFDEIKKIRRTVDDYKIEKENEDLRKVILKKFIDNFMEVN